MGHLVQYHKVWEQGSPFVGERPFVFAKNSPQKRSLALQAEKDRDRIWLIYRNVPTDTVYRVAFTFLATEVAVNEDQIKIFGDDVLLPSSLTLCRARTPWFKCLILCFRVVSMFGSLTRMTPWQGAASLPLSLSLKSRH